MIALNATETNTLYYLCLGVEKELVSHQWLIILLGITREVLLVSLIFFKYYCNVNAPLAYPWNKVVNRKIITTLRQLYFKL